MAENTDNIAVADSAQMTQAVATKQGHTLESITQLALALPYPDIPLARRKVLVINFDPELIMMPITARCELAGIGRRNYYSTLQNEAYKVAAKEMITEVWRAIQPEMQARYIAHSQSYSKGADKAMERILEQGESLREKVGANVQVSVTMTAEQIAERRHKNQAEGLRLLGLSVPDFLQIEGDNGNRLKQASNSPQTGDDDHPRRITVREGTKATDGSGAIGVQPVTNSPQGKGLSRPMDEEPALLTNKANTKTTDRIDIDEVEVDDDF